MDSPANLTQELGQLIGATVDKQDISITHRLPDAKSKKDRLIVKFVRREKLDECFKSRKHLGGKKSKRASIRGLWDGEKHPPRLGYVHKWIPNSAPKWTLWKVKQIQEGKQIQIPMDE